MSFILSGWEDKSNIFEVIYQTFDLEFAKKHGIITTFESIGSIVTFSGFDPKYDNAKGKLEEIAQRLERYRSEQESSLGYSFIRVSASHSIKFRDIGKDVFQLEVSVKAKVPSDYTLMSQTKTVKRYYTAALRGLIKEHLLENERIEGILQNSFVNLQLHFATFQDTWTKLTMTASLIDCLTSLATYCNTVPEPRCFPTIQDMYAESSFVSFEDGLYPLNTENYNFIRNSISIGGPTKVIVLTGPNMGGKSTILRLVGLLIVLAQLGCAVPAKSFHFYPFSSIFTRIGSDDNIIAGKSTFLTELQETAEILKKSTKNSLIIFDELGRGTCTVDG